jgi:hypothetical protein
MSRTHDAEVVSASALGDSAMVDLAARYGGGGSGGAEAGAVAGAASRARGRGGFDGASCGDVDHVVVKVACR